MTLHAWVWMTPVLLGLITVSAPAASLTELMNAPAHIFVSDENGEEFIDVNSNNVIDEGDIFRGVLDFDQFKRNNGAQVPLLHAAGNSELGGVFSIVVTSKVARGPFFPGEFNYTFGPDAAFEAQWGAGAAVVLWEDPGLTHFDIHTAASQAASEATVTDGDLFLVLGFANGGNAWTGQGLDDPTIVLNPSDRLGISVFALSRTSAAGTAGLYQFDLLSNNAGSGEFIGTSQIGGPFVGSPWQYSSETSAEFVVIPTPSALAGGAMLLAGLLGRRRR